jgi:hypothetical protein
MVLGFDSEAEADSDPGTFKAGIAAAHMASISRLVRGMT